MHIEELQEGEYDFPYHHLISVRPFSETRHLFWGYKYAAYLEKILTALEDIPFDSLIEIGCGDGKIITEVSRRFPGKKYAGTDYSEKSLRYARAFSPHISFETSNKDIFDALLLIEVIEHIPPTDIDAFVASVADSLAPGGFGIVSTPHVNMPLIPKHFQHFTREMIETIFSTHFEIVSFEYTSAETLISKVVQRLLANRFFILNSKGLVKMLYSFYAKHCLIATEENATQIFFLIRKR